jgi:hypothetical protein
VTALSAARRQAEEALAYNRRHIATAAGTPRFWTEHETRLDSALRALLAATARVAEREAAFDAQLTEIAAIVAPHANRSNLVDAVRDLAATAPAPQPAQTLTRAEAIAAGIPIPPDAVGVRIWGASVTAPAPQPDPSLLGRIEAACGIPDPAQACRTVLALCREARERGALDLRIGAPAPPAGDGVGELPADLWAMVAADDTVAVMDRLKAHFGLPPYAAQRGTR